MYPDVTVQEVELLNRFNLLSAEGKKELNDYLRYLLLKQYRAELYSQVLGNPLLHNGLMQAVRMCESENVELEEIVHKIRQVKQIYYQLLEKVFLKYAEAVDELYLYDSLRDWGRIGFEQVADAANKDCKEDILRELEEMLHNYRKLAVNRGDRRRIVAV